MNVATDEDRELYIKHLDLKIINLNTRLIRVENDLDYEVRHSHCTCRSVRSRKMELRRLDNRRMDICDIKMSIQALKKKRYIMYSEGMDPFEGDKEVTEIDAILNSSALSHYTKINL